MKWLIFLLIFKSYGLIAQTDSVKSIFISDMQNELCAMNLSHFNIWRKSQPNNKKLFTSCSPNTEYNEFLFSMLHDTAVVQYKTLENTYGTLTYELFIHEDTIPAVTAADLQLAMCTKRVINWEIQVPGCVGATPKGYSCNIENALGLLYQVKEYSICLLVYTYVDNTGVQHKGNIQFRFSSK